MTVALSQPVRISQRRVNVRKWTFRALLAVVVGVVLGAIIVQIVLWSSFPQKLVLSQIERQLGLRASAASLSTGWLGNTGIRDVKLGLPLADKSFLDVTEMRVKHTWLPSLLMGRSLSIQAIVLEKPTLYVRQDAAGTWNLKEVAELLARTGGKRQGQESAKTSTPELPKLQIHEATIVVIDYSGRAATILPINLDGYPDGPLIWRYDVKSPNPAGGDRVSLVGQVAPGATWKHQVNATVRDVGQWLQPWMGDLAQTLYVGGHWEGEVQDGRVAGRLVIEQAKLKKSQASGAVAVRTEPGGATVLPENLSVQTGIAAVPDVRLTSGTITANAKGVRAERLQLVLSGGQARVDGHYEPASRSGGLTADWQDLLVPRPGLAHSGSLIATLQTPLEDRPTVKVELHSNGKLVRPGSASTIAAPLNTWKSDFNVTAQGRGGLNFDIHLAAPTLAWQGRQTLHLDGLSADMDTRASGRSLELISVRRVQRPGGSSIEGAGEYSFVNGNWFMKLRDENLPMPLAEDAKFGFVLDAVRSDKLVTLNELNLHGIEAMLKLTGIYDLRQPRRTVDLKVQLRHVPPENASRDRPPLYGLLQGDAEVKGTLFEPTDLSIDGNLTGRQIVLIDRPLGDIVARLRGTVKDDGGFIKTDPLVLLGGHCWMSAAFPGKRGFPTDAQFHVENLPLENVGQLAKRPGLHGQVVEADWVFHVPSAKINEIEMEGKLHARDLRAPLFAADTLNVTMSMNHGIITADPISLQRKDGDADGRADARVEVDAHDIHRVVLDLAMANWPLEFSEGNRLNVFGGTKGLEVRLPKQSAKDPANPAFRATGAFEVTKANLTLGGKSAGKANLFADFRGRVIDLRTFRVDALGGNATGYALIDMDHPLEAKSRADWQDLQIEQLGTLYPAAKDLQGKFSGSMRLEPAAQERPLEPLSLTIELRSDGGRFRTIAIGPARIKAYTDWTRVVLADPERSPSTFAVAGGLVRAWGRVSKIDLPGQRPAYSQQLSLDFAGLSLDELFHAVDPKSKAVPGDVSGSLSLNGTTRAPSAAELDERGRDKAFLERLTRSLTAEGQLQLTNSDLANLDVVAVLYNAMNIGQDVQTPTGSGQLQIRVQDGNLQFSNVKYFNRGTEIIAVIAVQKIWQMPDSPIHGTAVGTARPLKEIKLPFLADVDQILTALQGAVTTVGIKGTVRERKIEPLMLNEIGGDMRRLLVGDVKSETRGSMGP